MRIEAVRLSRQQYESMGVGLPTLPLEKPLQLSDLGQCVVIAGKNGSGKTRLLKLLDNVAKKYLQPAARRTLEYERDKAVQNKLIAEGEILRLETQGPRQAQAAGLVDEHRRNVAHYESVIQQNLNALAASSPLTISGEGLPKIVFFTPKVTDLQDPRDTNEAGAIQQAESFASGLAAEGAHIGAPAYARSVMRAAVSERGARATTGSKARHESETRLMDMLASLLGDSTQFVLDENLNLTLAGMADRFNALLSEGQKVLFQLACMLHARQVSLHDCIILLDEPENHLHPAVLNDLIDRLLKVLTDGQLWIATHSVPLIAHVSATMPDCLWFAEDGKFSPAGRAPAKILNSLLGGPDGAARINELTLQGSRYASFLLLRQCVLPPGVIGYEGQDPQLDQIRDILDALRSEDQPLTVLDFGSGKGRLLDASADAAAGKPLSGLVDYVAYERDDDLSEHCLKRCAELYGSDTSPRVFNSLDGVLAARGEKFADVAIVCNVLHEVPPAEWLQEFGANSALARLLKDDGFILFVEDYAIPVGERAHEYGFLLLDEAELQILFGVTDDDIAHGWFNRNDHECPNYRGRLIAHAVSAKCLSRATEITRWKAIRSLHERSLLRLQRLLKISHGADTANALGRESALVTQLVANTALWLQSNPQIGSAPLHS